MGTQESELLWAAWNAIFLKKFFLGLVIKCLPVHLLTILLFGFLITMHKYQLKTCVRSPSLEPQINPLSAFCNVALAEGAVLSRWCCYWNLSVMSALGSRSGICGTRAKSLLPGFTFEGEGLPGLWESRCGWYTVTGCLWEAGWIGCQGFILVCECFPSKKPVFCLFSNQSTLTCAVFLVTIW